MGGVVIHSFIFNCPKPCVRTHRLHGPHRNEVTASLFLSILMVSNAWENLLGFTLIIIIIQLSETVCPIPLSPWAPQERSHCKSVPVHLDGVQCLGESIGFHTYNYNYSVVRNRVSNPTVSMDPTGTMSLSVCFSVQMNGVQCSWKYRLGSSPYSTVQTQVWQFFQQCPVKCSSCAQSSCGQQCCSCTFQCGRCWHNWPKFHSRETTIQ